MPVPAVNLSSENSVLTHPPRAGRLWAIYIPLRAGSLLPGSQEGLVRGLRAGLCPWPCWAGCLPPSAPACPRSQASSELGEVGRRQAGCLVPPAPSPSAGPRPRLTEPVVPSGGTQQGCLNPPQRDRCQSAVQPGRRAFLTLLGGSGCCCHLGRSPAPKPPTCRPSLAEGDSGLRPTTLC